MTQLASDDFDRADGGLGANWATTTDYTAILIASNEAEAQASAVCGGRYTATSAPDDGYSEIVVGSVVCTVSDEGIGPAYRISASAGTFYLVQTNTTETRLYRVVNASSYTQLGSDGAACVTGDVLRLTCNGTSISVQRNGTTFIGPVTDATIASGSAGMWAAAGASQGTAASWAFGDLNVAGVAIEESPLASRRNRPGRGPYSLGRYFRARVDAYADPAAAATGQLSQSIGTIELSAQGELSLTATLSEPIGAITLSSASTLTITGTASGSIGTIALSAQGALDITAVLSQPIGAITLSAQGSSGTTGTLSQSIGTITLSAAGQLPIVGSLSTTIGTIGLAATAQLPIVATLAATIGPITLSAEGTTISGAIGQLSQSIGIIGLSSAGSLTISGQLSQVMSPITLTSGGTLSIVGSLSQSIGQIVITARGGAPIEEPTKIGGDDVPRDRGHRGWDQKRSTIKRSEELRLEQSIRSIYRELTESPEMAPRAAAALARLAAPGTSEDELPRIAARRALAMDIVGVEVETSLRMLREELSELEQFHEATMIAALLERLL